MSRNFRIYLKNLDPLRIADDKTSQHGQTWPRMKNILHHGKRHFLMVRSVS